MCTCLINLDPPRDRNPASQCHPATHTHTVPKIIQPHTLSRKLSESLDKNAEPITDATVYIRTCGYPPLKPDICTVVHRCMAPIVTGFVFIAEIEGIIGTVYPTMPYTQSCYIIHQLTHCVSQTQSPTKPHC